MEYYQGLKFCYEDIEKMYISLIFSYGVVNYFIICEYLISPVDFLFSRCYVDKEFMKFLKLLALNILTGPVNFQFYLNISCLITCNVRHVNWKSMKHSCKNSPRHGWESNSHYDKCSKISNTSW